MRIIITDDSQNPLIFGQFPIREFAREAVKAKKEGKSIIYLCPKPPVKPPLSSEELAAVEAVTIREFTNYQLADAAQAAKISARSERFGNGATTEQML